MGLSRNQQAIVAAFRNEYEKHNPAVQQEIARAVSWAERHLWEVSLFFALVGLLVGLKLAPWL